MTDTFREGVALAVFGVFFILAVIAFVEFVCEVKDLPSISYRVGEWARERAWFATAIILIWATLLAHFFLNPLPTYGGGAIGPY